MRRLLGNPFLLLRRPKVVVAGVVLFLALAAAGPYLWGWYHWSRARSELAHYHSKDAQQHLNVCSRLWPNSPAVHLLAARADWRAGDYESALTHLHKCQPPEQAPSEEVVLESAMLHVASGDLREYEEYLQSRLAKEPALAPLIWEALAEGYVRMYRILDALACLDRWLTAEPDNVQALFLRGQVWRQVQVVQKYVPDYRRVVELDPERNEAREYLAGGLLELGQFSEALPHLEHLLRLRPRDPDLLVRLARCHNGLGHLEQARQILDDVLADHPENGPALRAYGQFAMMVGQPEEAEQWLRKAARVLPYDYSVQYALYQALEKQEGKTAEAKQQQVKAQQLKDRRERLSELTHRKMSQRPFDPALHCELGNLLISLGYREVGASWLRSALQNDPNYQPAHAALADYYQQEGDAEQAAYHRQQARTLPPPPPSTSSAKP